MISSFLTFCSISAPPWLILLGLYHKMFHLSRIKCSNFKVFSFRCLCFYALVAVSCPSKGSEHLCAAKSSRIAIKTGAAEPRTVKFSKSSLLQNHLDYTTKCSVCQETNAQISRFSGIAGNNFMYHSNLFRFSRCIFSLTFLRVAYIILVY